MSLDLIASMVLNSATRSVADATLKIVDRWMSKKGIQHSLDDLRDNEKVAAALESISVNFNPKEEHNLTKTVVNEAQRAAIQYREERMRQAKHTFNAALALAVLGTLIILGGVIILIFRDSVATGAMTAGVGAVVEVISAVLFLLNKQTNDRLDRIGHDLGMIEAARVAMQLIEKIENSQKRDDAIREAAKALGDAWNKAAVKRQVSKHKIGLST